ncbi:MAG TPA: HAD-IA family hydrolase [Vicinamibacterales bacterium]|jgi:phosphoglycolate phosphatase|nr:HAD-IA family hydrolase [Vicinamibacterales bacterium]
MGDVHRLIAFDLDGTLIDSRRDLADSANDLIRELGGEPLSEEAIGRMVGDGARLLVRRALTAAGLEETDTALTRFLAFYDERLLNHTRLYDGAEDVVRMAREQARVVVLTNKPKAPSERILAGLGVRGLFADVVGGDGPLPRKPDPASLLALMQAAGTEARTTLMVGDSAIDHRTALNAGVRPCLVSYGFGFATFAREQLTGGEWIAGDIAALKTYIADFLVVTADR